MTKRSFGFNTTSLTTSLPLLDTGFYAGEIAQPSITKKDGSSFFKIVEEKVWNTNTKVRETTGDYVVSGMVMYSAILTSKRAAVALQRDEPRVFGGMFFLRFNKETFQLVNNQVVGQLLALAGLGDTNLEDNMDWEHDDNIEVPSELAGVDNIVDMLNAVEYYKAMFTLICQSIDGLPVKVSVIKRPTRDNPEMQENAINMGSGGNPFCGFLEYVEGSENDLED